MNWRRGLFRLWIVGAAIFVIAVAAISYSSFEAEFSQAAETRGLIAQIEAAQPNKTFELKLPDGRRVEIQKPDRQSAVEDVPEILTSLGIPPRNPWVTVGRAAAIAFGVPLVVLILGSSLVWAFSGFAVTRK